MQLSRRTALGALAASALALCGCAPERAGTGTPTGTAAGTPAGPGTAAPTTGSPVPPAAVPPAAAAPPADGPAAGSPALALTVRHSLTDPASQWILVNKHTPLNPPTFAPADLRQPQIPADTGEALLLRDMAATAAEAMFAAAAAAGAPMVLLSGYRSYQTQVGLYASYAAVSGAALADTYSARAGYSEHQTGLAMDIGAASGACPLQYCFVLQPAAIWAAANAHRFGFILRYQQGHNLVTGFYAESWHYRFVGVELATDLVGRGFATLEEYFGKPAAPAYL
ncbi:MAG: D-alanyl-D-alanine carboxypeptidase family protein [Actinomycetales bacterium]